MGKKNLKKQKKKKQKKKKNKMSSSFQSSAMLFRFVLVVCHPVASFRSGQWSIPCSVPKYMVCCLASDWCLHSSGVRSETMGLFSWTPPSLVISLILSSLLNPLLLSPLAKNLGGSVALLSSVFFMYLGPSHGRIEGEKKFNSGLPHPTGIVGRKNYSIILYGFNVREWDT